MVLQGTFLLFLHFFHCSFFHSSSLLIISPMGNLALSNSFLVPCLFVSLSSWLSLGRGCGMQSTFSLHLFPHYFVVEFPGAGVGIISICIRIYIFPLGRLKTFRAQIPFPSRPAHLHILRVFHHQTHGAIPPRCLEIRCSFKSLAYVPCSHENTKQLIYSCREADSIPCFGLVGRFLCTRSVSYGAMLPFYSYSVLKPIPSENARLNPKCLGLGSRFCIFSIQRAFLFLRRGQYGGISIAWSMCYGVPTD